LLFGLAEQMKESASEIDRACLHATFDRTQAQSSLNLQLKQARLSTVSVLGSGLEMCSSTYTL